MEIDYQDELAILLRDCVNELPEIEALFIKSCYLAEPRISMKAFADEHGLTAKDVANMRVLVMNRLREELAKKKVHCVANVV